MKNVVEINIIVSKAFARKIEKAKKFTCRYVPTMIHLIQMPNQMHIDKVQFKVVIDRELKRALEKAAAQRGETLTEYVTYLLWKATRDINLDKEDYERIIAEIKKDAPKRGIKLENIKTRSRIASEKSK